MPRVRPRSSDSIRQPCCDHDQVTPKRERKARKALVTCVAPATFWALLHALFASGKKFRRFMWLLVLLLAATIVFALVLQPDQAAALLQMLRHPSIDELSPKTGH